MSSYMPGVRLSQKCSTWSARTVAISRREGARSTSIVGRTGRSGHGLNARGPIAARPGSGKPGATSTSLPPRAKRESATANADAQPLQ